jgi:MFS family permease
MEREAAVEPAKRDRLPLFALLGANAISMVGNVLAMIAIPWFVLQTTASASKTGLTAFFTALPAILAAFFGGTIVDRLGYKRTSIISDIASAITVALVPLLYFTTGLAFWQLLALVFLGALLDAPGSTARLSLLPDVTGLAGMTLERANSAAQAIQRGSQLLGAPLAGLLIALLGTSNVLWVNAASFAVSALMIATMVPAAHAVKGAAATEGYLNELKKGLQFIRRDRLILTIVMTVMMTNFLDAPIFSVIMPVYVKQSFGSAVGLGLMLAAFGGGALLGTIIFGAIGHRMPRRATFIGAFIIVGLQFWILTTLPGLPVAMLVLATMGVTSGPLNPIILTVTQERIPADMRGRVFGTLTAGAYLAVPLGMVLAGYLLDWIGIRATLLAQAACYFVITFSLLFNPALREMNRTENQDRANRVD